MFLPADDCRYMAGKILVVGFSGGADSMSLVHFLAVNRARYGWDVRAAHLNHCLRGEESLRDEDAVRAFCREMGVPLSVRRENVGALAGKGRSLEDAGREARYAFFAGEAERAAAEGKEVLVLTAHTLSDDLETALYRLVRGSGPDGLCGIRKKRALGAFTLFRPLLEVRRAEVERYCAENRLPYVTDSSNLSDGYARNRLRLKVVPELAALNPALEEAYGRLKRSLSADRDLLQGEAERCLQAAAEAEGRWKLPPLRSAPEPVRRRAEERILRQMGAGVSEKRLAALDRVTLGEAKGFSAGGVRFACRGGCLCAEEEAVYQSGEQALPVLPPGEEKALCFPVEKYRAGGECVEVLHKTLWLRRCAGPADAENPKVYKKLLYSGVDYATIKDNVVLRARRPGDSIKLPGRGGRKPLKKLFQEARLPHSERETRLVLAKGNDIVWLEGFGTGEGYLPRGEDVLFLRAEGRDRKDVKHDE